MLKTDFERPARFLYNLYENDHKFLFMPLSGDENIRKINLFSEFEVECRPQDSVGKFTYICNFERVDGNKLDKVRKKNAHSIIW